MKLLFLLWTVMSEVGLYSCTLIHTDTQGGGKVDSFISHWAHGGGLKIAVFFVSHSQSFTFSYPLVYLSTLSVYTSLILPVSLSPHLLISLALSFSLFPYWSVFLPFWSFLVSNLPWTVFQSSWPAGMRGSYQTSQMVEVFLVMKSWTWNNTLANCSSRYELSREKKEHPCYYSPLYSKVSNNCQLWWGYSRKNLFIVRLSCVKHSQNQWNYSLSKTEMWFQMS